MSSGEVSYNRRNPFRSRAATTPYPTDPKLRLAVVHATLRNRTSWAGQVMDKTTTKHISRTIRSCNEEKTSLWSAHTLLCTHLYEIPIDSLHMLLERHPQLLVIGLGESELSRNWNQTFKLLPGDYK